jgi:hypothetical protein
MPKAHALGARWPDELLSIAVHFCLHIWRKRVGDGGGWGRQRGRLYKLARSLGRNYH